MRIRFAVGVALLSLAGCWKSESMPGSTPAPVSQSFDVRLQEVFGATAGLGSVMDLQAPPGDARLFIAQRSGLIRVVEGGSLLAAPFLDISGRVTPFVGEDGLISFAFDPQYATNGFVYVHFIEKNNIPSGEIVVERYQVSADRNVLQTPGVPVIRISHPDNTNHYGGRVAFGPDGMLYLSTGDGGGGDNQYGHAQDATSHLGKLLRIDVSTLPYTIPPTNPVFPGAARSENWAIGLRNPFRYTFDGAQLYIADVGQSMREEIDVASASAAGLNYGWSIMEGTVCRAIGGPCTTPGLTAPVYDYDHSHAECAIIGGYVYRGSAMPALRGTYFFSDLCLGFVRGLTMQNGIATVVQAPNANAGAGVTQSFGQDGAGELYMLTGDGRVLKIVQP
ncbi:MAG TPA: PQQ-dependent sugar dehydrogenase [Burkholderiales bacterium]|nr:PQQ-dependent sugar dehydrogenase [Burkholderiales bacterium]